MKFQIKCLQNDANKFCFTFKAFGKNDFILYAFHFLSGICRKSRRPFQDKGRDNGYKALLSIFI